MNDQHQDQDDLDRLFGQAPPPAPPADVGGRARARLQAIRGARRLTLLALADSAALVTLALLAFLLGAAVTSSEVPAVLRLVLEDRALALETKEEVTRALLDGTPWRYVALTALDALLLVALTSYLLRATDRVRLAERGSGRR